LLELYCSGLIVHRFVCFKKSTGPRHVTSNIHCIGGSHYPNELEINVLQKVNMIVDNVVLYDKVVSTTMYHTESYKRRGRSSLHQVYSKIDNAVFFLQNYPDCKNK